MVNVSQEEKSYPRRSVLISAADSFSRGAARDGHLGRVRVPFHIYKAELG